MPSTPNESQHQQTERVELPCRRRERVRKEPFIVRRSTQHNTTQHTGETSQTTNHPLLITLGAHQFDEQFREASKNTIRSHTSLIAIISISTRTASSVCFLPSCLPAFLPQPTNRPINQPIDRPGRSIVASSIFPPLVRLIGSPHIECKKQLRETKRR